LNGWFARTAEKAELSDALGKAVAEVAAAKEAGQPFTVAISGGSLPKLLAAGLLAVEGVNYDSWHVFFADERVVPLDDDDSNYKACDEVFFSKAGIAREQIYTVDASLSAEEAATAYTKQLETVFGAESIPSFDLVLLGMGPDGHTASLFPGHALLEVRDRWVASIEDSPKPPPKRITLTYPVLDMAQNVFFVCTGAGKSENLAIALGASEGSVPAGEVKPSSGNLVWFVDDEASADYRAKNGL
jgi:6-phosphogluconolactonase